jgi:hypothetical protein
MGTSTNAKTDRCVVLFLPSADGFLLGSSWAMVIGLYLIKGYHHPERQRYFALKAAVVYNTNMMDGKFVQRALHNHPGRQPCCRVPKL